MQLPRCVPRADLSAQEKTGNIAKPRQNSVVQFEKIDLFALALQRLGHKGRNRGFSAAIGAYEDNENLRNFPC